MVYEGHFDFTMINMLPPHILRHTLIVLALRRPADRIVSSFYHLRSLSEKNHLELDSVGLHRFAEHGYGAEDTINRMTKTLAGEYCCYNSYPPTGDDDPERMWNLAMESFRKVGVVLVSEDMRDSLLYLARVLGWRNADVDLHLNSGSRWQQPTDEAILQALRNSNSLDNKLYELALDRFKAQRRILLHGE
jgi:hypothetical protein